MSREHPEVLLERQGLAIKHSREGIEEAIDSKTSSQAVVQMTGIITEDKIIIIDKEDRIKRYRTPEEVAKTTETLKTMMIPLSSLLM